MKLTIVIVNYNVEFFLEHCLHSVRKALKGIESEVIVVDNNSVDGSVKMVREKFPEIRLIENKKNVGFSVANNQAIRQAQGEYILLQNPDTVVEEDTFQKVLQFMDTHPEAGGLGVKMLDGKGKFLPESKRGLPTPLVAFYKVFGFSMLFPRSRLFGRYHLGFLDNDQIHSVAVLSGAFMLLRKTTLEKTGLLDESFFMYGEDIDISYRITQAGYKNYYFPQARIIHYKGESTKKSSINYVFVFYQAMIIFAQKHFSQNRAKLFSTLIHMAIYIRASLALIRRFAENFALPLLDTGTILAGLFFIKNYYEKNVRFAAVTGSYPEHLVSIAFLSYLVIWLSSIYMNGGYDKPVRVSRLTRGILIGTATILIIYSLLPETYRFSRALILFGTAWALVATTGIRFLLHLLNIKQYRLNANQNKRVLIVGNPEECERVHQLLKETSIKTTFVGYISPEENVERIKSKTNQLINARTVGNINQLQDYVEIYSIDEIIFCAKDVSSHLTINLMLQLGKANVDYKIAPPESLSVIGSNSIDTSGDLYTIDINSITKPGNRRVKRMFDLSTSLLAFLLSPLILLFIHNPRGFLKNTMSVISGKKSWIGYQDSVLSPSEILGKKLNKETAERINLLYTKDYQLENDFKIFFKGFKKLGNMRS